MAADATQASVRGTGPEVMASVEEVGEGSRLVIADISRDGAWVTADWEAALSLEAWR